MIYFNTRDTFIRIELSQIMYFVADGNYTLLQLNNNQKLMFTFSLHQTEIYLKEKLGDRAKIFVRIGKSHIVNLTKLNTIEIVKQKLRLYDNQTQQGFELSASKEALRKLREMFIGKQKKEQNG